MAVDVEDAHLPAEADHGRDLVECWQSGAGLVALHEPAL
jgi:hypothetical protein